jgi:IMP dehydrogenase
VARPWLHRDQRPRRAWTENGIITDPVTLPPDETVGTARNLMDTKHIGGVPITVNGFLKGILTRRDLRFLGNDSCRPLPY